MGECNFILNIFPNHPQALRLVTQACLAFKSSICRLDEVFTRAVEINPKIPGTYLIQGVYQYRARQYEKAIESFKGAVAIDSDLADAHYDLGLTYVQTKQYDLANDHAQRAYALGYPLPGLRDKLMRAGKWKPEAVSGPSAPADTPAAAGKK